MSPPDTNDAASKNKDEARKNALAIHADVGKNLLTSSSLILVITVAFLGSRSWPQAFSAASILVVASLSAIIGSILSVILASHRISDVAKKLAGTKFQDQRIDKMSEQDVWNEKSLSATRCNNWASFLFVIGAALLVSSGGAMILNPQRERDFPQIFSRLRADLESTKRMVNPISWETVARDKSREVYTIVLEDGMKKRLVCEVEFGGELRSCAP